MVAPRERLSSQKAAIPVLLCALLIAVGCRRPPEEPSGSLQLVTSLPPQAWLVQQIAGPEAQVSYLVAPGDSPATFRPTDHQITELNRASLFFRGGSPFEANPWFAALAEGGQTEIVDLRDGIRLSDTGLSDTDGYQHADHVEGGGDPHIWLSPRLLAIQSFSVLRALTKIDPARADLYEERHAAFKQSLKELDRELRQTLAPLADSSFFVFHPAWDYFARQYGMQQIAIEIDGQEPSDAELTELIAAARTHDVQVVFVQPQIDGRAVQTVATAIGARVEILDPMAPDIFSNLREVARRLVAARSGTDSAPSG